MASTITQPTLDQLARHASETDRAKVLYNAFAAAIVDIEALQAANGTTDFKESVRLATAAALAANTRTSNVLTADANGALGNIDGVAAVVGNRVLVKDEATGANNGIYTVTSLGSGGSKWSLTRATDADTSAEMTAGVSVFVSEGTANGNSIFDLTTDDTITLNTTSLTFTKRPTLAELASTSASKGASLIGIQDADSLYDGATAEAAIREARVQLALKSTTELTIASGAVTATQSMHRIDTEADAASDDLDTISGTADGKLYFIRPENAARNIVIRDTGGGTGNIRTPRAQSITLAAVTDWALLVSDGTNLTVIAHRTAAGTSKSIPLHLGNWREVTSGGDPGNIAAIGGHLASDTTPILRADAAESGEISWATGNADIIGQLGIAVPPDFNGASDVTVDIWVYTDNGGGGGIDAATFTVETSWDGGAIVVDTATDGTPATSHHKITATIAAADVPNSPSYFSIFLTPDAHAADPVQVVGARMNYTSTSA